MRPRDQLLAIDVTSEIRNLCDAQLRGTWQMPAELVRFALRFGAPWVSVSRGWRGFSFRWTGDPIARSTIEQLALALDGSQEPSLRQRAIADLESTGAEALLWAGGAAGSRLRVDTVAGGITMRLNLRAGQAQRLVRTSRSAPTDEVVLHWSCSKLDRRRAELWLRMACRFASAEVVLDGRPVPRGFSGGMYRMRLDRPVPCTLGLTRGGDEPVLWLLRDGVVAARAVLPGYPPFEAAVELGGLVSGAVSSSDLNRAVMPFVADLSDRAVDMVIQIAGRPNAMSGSDSERVAAVLLRAASRGLRTREIRSLPLLRTLSGGGRMVSVDHLDELARRCGGRLSAVEPGARVDGLMSDSESTIAATPEVRNLVAELTGIRFQTPPRHRTGPMRRLAERARGAASRFSERARGEIWNRALPPDLLSTGERRLLDRLGVELSPRTVAIGRGVRLGRTATGFVIPRNDPVLADAVSRLNDDPAWLYPLVLALNLGDPPPESLRSRWRNFIARG